MNWWTRSQPSLISGMTAGTRLAIVAGAAILAGCSEIPEESATTAPVVTTPPPASTPVTPDPATAVPVEKVEVVTPDATEPKAGEPAPKVIDSPAEPSSGDKPGV